MFKNLLIKCCNLIGRDDITSAIKSVSKIEDIIDNDIKNDVLKLMSYYNYVVSSVFENYLNIEHTEKVTSNSSSQIEYFVLSYIPVKILKLEDENFTNISFISKPGFLITNAPNKEYYITYRMVPPKINSLAENIVLPKPLNEKIICLGVASEFLISKGKFDEGEYLNNKFLYEIFKVKTHKERRLKSTFCL